MTVFFNIVCISW